MQVSVESTGNLERRVILSLPMGDVDDQVGGRLREMARTARIKGFRPGKVPTKVIEQRYGQQVRTLGRGQRLAPGIVLQDIDADGLIFDNQGRRERLPWPPRPAVTGFKRQG